MSADRFVWDDYNAPSPGFQVVSGRRGSDRWSVVSEEREPDEPATTLLRSKSHDPAIIARFFISGAKPDEFDVGASDVGVKGLRSSSIGVADLIEAERGVNSQDTGPVRDPVIGAGFGLEEFRIEIADLVAKSPALRVMIGEDEPPGDSPVLVAVVIEDGSGQIGATEGPIDPASHQPGDGLVGRE